MHCAQCGVALAEINDRFCSQCGARVEEPSIGAPGTTLRGITHEVAAKHLSAGERLLFVSPGPLVWETVATQPSPGAIQRADLMDTVGAAGLGISPTRGGAYGAALIASRRTRRAQRLDSLILTDQRLLLVKRGVVQHSFDLDPWRVRQWMVAQRELRPQAGPKLPRAPGGPTPPPPCPVTEVFLKRHLLRPTNSVTGCLFYLVAFPLLAVTCTSYGLTIGGLLFAALVVLNLGLRARPWVGVRLRVTPVVPRVPQWLAGWAGAKSWDREIQLRSDEDSLEFVRHITPMVTAIKDALTEKPRGS